MELEGLSEKKFLEDEKIADLTLTEESAKNSIRAIMLVRAYRIRGHLIANLDPLGLMVREEHPELKPETYGFTKNDLDKKIFLDGVLGLPEAKLSEIINILKKTYSGNIGYEFMHMGDPEEKTWIRDRVEGKEKDVSFTANGKPIDNNYYKTEWRFLKRLGAKQINNPPILKQAPDASLFENIPNSLFDIKVELNSTVKIKYLNKDKVLTIKLVDYQTQGVNIENGVQKVSIKKPLGASIKGKSIGDEIEIKNTDSIVKIIEIN